MNKKDFAQKFLAALNSNNDSEIRQFFTPIAVVYSLDEYHPVALADFIEKQKKCNSTRQFVELSESRVAFKVRYTIDGAPNSFNIELDGKRISHLDYASR